MEKITERLIKNLPRPVKGNRVIWDSEIKGFGVRITAAGSKAFVLRYVFNARERRYTIGEYGTAPGLNTSLARERALKLKAVVADGRDPLSARIGLREAPTMKDLAREYMERHALPHKRPASARGDRSMIEKAILPKLGNRKAMSIGRMDVEELHQSLKATPYRANRVLALLSKMFSLAIEWEWVPRNPSHGIKRFPEKKRERWLSMDELRRLMNALDASDNKRAVNAIRLLILTGARRSEALRAEWDHVDFERGVWTKPSHHTKQKKTEYVPLSAPALMLLSQMKEDAFPGIQFIFPGDAVGKPLQDIKKAWTRIRKEAELKDVRLHDIRHTYASHLVSSGLSLEIVGRLLGHTQPQTTARYAHLADDPLREATDRFGAIAEGASGKRSSASIVKLRGETS